MRKARFGGANIFAPPSRPQASRPPMAFLGAPKLAALCLAVSMLMGKHRRHMNRNDLLCRVVLAIIVLIACSLIVFIATSGQPL